MAVSFDTVLVGDDSGTESMVGQAHKGSARLVWVQQSILLVRLDFIVHILDLAMGPGRWLLKRGLPEKNGNCTQ